ncbi:binding-protein-dependent transport systems inner membrane component [Pyrobaculum islandicum DSM 4184]|uniref:Binding-protein-dependent transport systems inner membrane component n=1 Tax=Pyrobaculum islandicum (strain DSM 4184 / JCM 9189 / GEO3) TaxID=384616 RepID=A1RT06_PYRIL|nr:ABC transporter permease [Pyrobaculum islandicum]ABL88088.1 binding-protein-dependent transport systems inner membrane component [Pyrobaculum islandicum DSM 4184]
MASLVKTLIVKAITLVIVLIGVLVLLAVILGATGLSDKLLKSILVAEVQEYKQQLIRQGFDPAYIEKAVAEYNKTRAEALGLDKPWFVRLPQLIQRLLLLDLGTSRTLQSSWGSNRISDLILDRLPNTIILTTTGISLTALVGIWLGLYIGSNVGSRADRIISILSAASYALPLWFVSLVLILVLAYAPKILWGIQIFPPGGMVSTPPPSDPLAYVLDVLWHLSLPLLASFIVFFGSWAYGTRNIVLSVSQEDFVAFARAKGLPEGLVRRRYILRPSLPPILTNLILSLAFSISGYIITERVFNWPGMGSLYYSAITALDEPVIFALTYIFTLVYIIARFILEILYVIVDPRIRLT